jgi:S1-C subfamily serine protease
MRIRRKPFEMVRQKIDSIHDAAADWVEKQAGPDSGIRVKRRGRGGERGGDRLDLDVVLEKPLVVPDGPVSEAWSALRRLVLGLVDGSELPGGIDQTRLVNGRGQRALVAEPAALAADPEAEPPPVAGFGGRICDPLHLDPELARVEDADEEGAETERRALAEWSEQHSSTLLWRVGLRIARSLRAAEAEAEAEVATQAVAGEEESTEDEQERDASSQAERRRLRRRLRNSLLLRSGVALLLAAGAIGRLNLIGIAAALAAIGVLWVLGLAGAARHWFLADEQISRREDEEELARLNAALRRSLRMGDRIRLERRYREFLDWAEAIGRLVHKPWVGDPLDRVSLSPPVDHASLPAAFSVAIAETSELGLERLSAAAGAGVFNPGWLSALYENTERLEMTEMLVRRGRAAEDAEVSRPDPAADVGKDPQGPRRQLLDAIVRGAHRSLTESDFSEDVLRYIADLEPDRVCERVAVLPTADGATAGEEIDALPPALAGFEPPTVLPQLVADLSPTVVGVVCEAGYRQLTGSGVVVGEGRIATARALVDGARSIEVVTADGRRLGAELTGTDPNAGLAVLALESTGELPSAPLPEAVTVRQGDAVVSIGRPRPELDRPAVGWGLVTSAGAAASLQVAYQGEAGAAGSPLFDLDGRLLGVHCPADAAGESAGRVTSVVPVARLQALLEGGIGSTDGAPLERADRGPGRGEAVTRASAFIDELTNVETAPALLPHHWKDADSKNETRETIPAAEEAHSGSEKLTNLVAGLAFRAPLRVLVHRVDLVAPVAVAELASFPSIEDEDPGPAEKHASTPF